MKRFLTFFFVTLGVIFFILILLAAYFYITDPWNLKPLLFGSQSTVTTVVDGEGGAEVREPARDANPMLNEQQEAALETVGIDPAGLPSEITPAQEACFVERLGAERVEEIKAGDTPTAMEFFSARSCLGNE